MEDLCEFTLKFVMIGDIGSGKSSIHYRYRENCFHEHPVSTIMLEFLNRNITIQNKRIKIQLWDTVGRERFKAISTLYYKRSSGSVIVYDITNRESFKNISGWYDELVKHSSAKLPIILVGNKIDIAAKREVSFQEASEFAVKYGMNYIESSAKTGENIDEIFEILSNAVLDSRNSNIDNKNTIIHKSPSKIEKAYDKIKDYCV